MPSAFGEDRGPADEYEVVWRTGHVDRFKAHQVTWTGGSLLFMAPQSVHVRFHVEDDAGRWVLVLDALQDDLLTVRNVTKVDDGLK